MRREICRGLEFLGVELDEHRNQVRKAEAIISKEGAKVAVFVVPTNEEIVVARETARIISEIRQ
jgi:acetate kinase